MSGVAGADRVKSRQDFQQFITSYKNLIAKFPGFQGMNPSGSYNSDMSKNDFGDIDLVVHITSDKDKATVKKELQAFFHAQPETVIVPFSSEKHAGKRSYNAGELVSVRYHDDRLGYSAQIDNIIALDQTEATFKQQFLDWPAEKQGLILGLVKIAAIETEPAVLFKKLGISAPTQLEQNQEYEFNLSSVELQLRLVTYDPELLSQGQYKQTGRETVWTSRNFDDIQKLLYQYNLDAGFDQLLAQSKKVIKNPRSNARMQGVFGSMITVKSGEVGTAKGANKIAALDKIKNTLGETRSIFRALLEAPQPSTVVFAFGRLQPPTIGHELLINEVKQVAQQHGCPYVIYVSKTVGKTPAEKLKNPLTVEQKMSYLQRMFPGTNFAPATDVINTPIKAAQHLNQKYQNLIMVAGGSRAEEFEKLLNDYNGKDYNFDTIKVIKIDRDPDAEDASGMSGTKMRQAAAADNYNLFKSGLPGTIDDATAQQLMADVKAGMTPTPKVKKAKEGLDSEQPNSAENGLAQVQQAGIKIKSPRSVDGGPVEDNLIQAIKLLQQTLGSKFGIVTAMNDRWHQKQTKPSDHVTGKGADFTVVPPPMNAEQAAEIKNRINKLLQTAGLPVRYVGDEYFAQRAPNATGGHFHISMTEDLDTKKTWADYGMADTELPKEKIYHGWTEYEKDQEEKKEKQQAAKKVDKPVKEKMMPASMFAGSDKNKLGVAGQWRNKGAKKNSPAKAGDLVGGAEESVDRKEHTLNELNTLAPRSMYVKMPDGNWLKADYRETETIIGGGHASNNMINFTSFQWVKPQTVQTLGLENHLTKTGTNPRASSALVGQSGTDAFILGDRSIDVIDFNKPDSGASTGELPRQLKLQIVQWVEKHSPSSQGVEENNNMEPGPTSSKRGVGSQNYVSRPQAPMGPMEAVKSAAARLQSALQREKERRQSRERLGQELLNPKKPEPKQVPVDKVSEQIIDTLINKIIVNEAISNNKR